MKAVRLDGSLEHSVLKEVQVPEPVPGQGELLIRVHATGVTPTELGWYPTKHTKTGAARTGAIPGHEFSGVVEAKGPGAEGFQVGEAVYGMNDWFADGTTAEFCTALPGSVAPKPAKLTHSEAASVPISALTAWQALIERQQLQAGERVLIHGGAGAVGLFAVQIARLRSAHITATASAHNLAFVRELGADEVIDYKASRFEYMLHDVDVVLDTVGGETLARSWRVLKPGGRLVTVAGTEEASTDERVKKAFLLVEAKGKQLQEIGLLLDSGRLRPVVDSVVSFAQAADAYAGKIERRGQGKVVVQIVAMP